MIADAREERNERAERSFTWASEVEKGHNVMFDKVLAAVKAGEAVPETDYHVCRNCGHTAAGTAPAKCPVCGTDDSYEAVA
jgi:rubrerythrin